MDDQGQIIIIDDEQVVLDSCRDILASSNYSILTASDGTAGLRLIKEIQPDLVFVDLKMPGITGMQVLEKVQEFDPTIVTVVITGYATINSAVEAMKHGAYDFLPKPFTPAEFRMITKRSLEKRKLILEAQSLRREKEMLRKNFAAIVSHEMKSPLSSVQQNLYVLTADVSEQINDEQKKTLERMKERISDLLKLINTWLQAMAIDLESIKEQFAEISLDLVIDKAVDSVQNHATRKDITIIVTDIEPDSKVYGDEGTLIEVLVNLLSNALKYSYSGRNVSIVVEERNDRAYISVSDQGVGISEEELPFIFDDFYRGKGRLGDSESHGLGLALSKRIVEIHGGSISATSEIGKGSNVVFNLPIFEPETDPQPALQANGRKDLNKEY
jgi:two-component system sensor histidine kinase/response regulator